MVHLHGLDFASYLPGDGPPRLVTLHMPVDWSPAGALYPARTGVHLVPVSDNQAARAPANLPLLPPIPNGVDPATYAPSPTKRDFALVIGRVAPEKGFHDAVAAARLADVPLVAASRLFPYPDYYRYFAERLRPELDVQRRFLGPVAGEAKCRLLARARCVLIPSTAPERRSTIW
jgi:glycosyltransferase involved in cell wall biosynthesis